MYTLLGAAMALLLTRRAQAGDTLCHTHAAALSLQKRYEEAAKYAEYCHSVDADPRALWVAATAWKFAKFYAHGYATIEAYLQVAPRAREGVEILGDAEALKLEFLAATVEFTARLAQPPLAYAKGHVRAEFRGSPSRPLLTFPAAIHPGSHELFRGRFDEGEWRFTLHFERHEPLEFSITFSRGSQPVPPPIALQTTPVDSPPPDPPEEPQPATPPVGPIVSDPNPPPTPIIRPREARIRLGFGISYSVAAAPLLTTGAVLLATRTVPDCAGDGALCETTVVTDQNATALLAAGAGFAAVGAASATRHARTLWWSELGVGAGLALIGAPIWAHGYHQETHSEATLQQTIAGEALVALGTSLISASILAIIAHTRARRHDTADRTAARRR